jgi:hypothetical protein
MRGFFTLVNADALEHHIYYTQGVKDNSRSHSPGDCCSAALSSCRAAFEPNLSYKIEADEK